MSYANQSDIARIANRLTEGDAQSFIKRAFDAHVGPAFGFESVDVAGRTVEYLNCGDTYDGTVARVDGGNWNYTCWGDEVAAIENESVDYDGPGGFGFTVTVGEVMGMTAQGDVGDAVEYVAERLIGQGLVDSAQDDTMREAIQETGAKDEDELSGMDTEELLQWVLFCYVPDLEQGERCVWVGV